MTLTEVDIRRSIEALLIRHGYQLKNWDFSLRIIEGISGDSIKIKIVQMEATKEEKVK